MPIKTPEVSTISILATEPTLSVVDRITPPAELQKPEIKSIESACNLQINSDLKAAKYDVELEIGRLIRGTNTALAEGKSLTESVKMSAEEVEINLREYNLEIIQQRPVLPHLNRLDISNGVLRMVGNSGEPVVNAITAQERDGAPLEASKQIEEFLLSAPDNSFAVLMSPPGWNGFMGEYGQEAEPHFNAETMIFWKNQQGTLKGLTLVTDLSEEQARQTMINLGVSEEAMKGNSGEERLANIVRNPAMLAFPRSDINPFEYVLEKIMAVRGSEDIRLKQRDGTLEIRTIDEVKKDIGRFDELLQLSLEEESLVTQPKEFILKEIDRLREGVIQQEIVNKIEKAILLLAREQLKRNGVYTKTVIPASSVIPAEAGTHTNNRDDFSPEIVFLKSRGGCPASVAARVLAGVSLGQNIGGAVYFGSRGEVGKKGKTCTSCGEVNYCTKMCYKCDGMLI